MEFYETSGFCSPTLDRVRSDVEANEKFKATRKALIRYHCLAESITWTSGDMLDLASIATLLDAAKCDTTIMPSLSRRAIK